MNIPSNITTLIAGIVLTLVSLWYGKNHGLMPVAASEDASQVDDIFNLMMTVATGLFILIQGVLIVSFFKFRRRKDDQTDGPPIEGNIPLEILWTAIPAVIVLIISVYSFEIYNAMGGLDPMASHDRAKMAQMSEGDSSAPQNLIAFNPGKGAIALGLGATPAKEGDAADLTVNVLGVQYAWIFTYPDLGLGGGDLHVPVGKEVQLNISAADVIHSFWLPEFRIKQDAIPGRDAVLTFTSNRVGEYPIICAELCGSYHGGMVTKLYVHSAEDYQAWLQSQQIASTDDLKEAIAVNPAQLSDSEFLAPYAGEIGIDSQTLQQIQ